MEVCVWECEIERPHGGDMAMGSGDAFAAQEKVKDAEREADQLGGGGRL